MRRRANPYAKSVRAFGQACRYLVGGVNSPVRAFRDVGLRPLFIAGGKGSKIYDIDGNEFIDYVCSWGPMILGHCHPKVLAVIKSAVKQGSSFGAPTIAETQLAERIVSAYRSIEKVRFVSSGTEAVMTAIRLARAYSGRDFVIKMAGCYHGHSDGLLVAGGSGLAESSAPSSAGVPRCVAQLTIVVPYNDLEAVKKAFSSYRKKIAAVLVEPVAANMGVVVPQAGYLQGLRDLCTDSGSLLIFDEVITGFRVALGGAQELYGVSADLTCLGKIVGGGLPAAAVGGRADIMDLLAPAGPVYQAGTLSGNPLAMAAGGATLEILSRRGCYTRLEAISARLEKGLCEAARDAGVAITINRVGSICSCFFTDKPVRNLDEVKLTNTGQFKMFFGEMLRRGVYLAPSAFEAMFISLAHGRADIDRTTAAAGDSFSRVKKCFG